MSIALYLPLPLYLHSYKSDSDTVASCNDPTTRIIIPLAQRTSLVPHPQNLLSRPSITGMPTFIVPLKYQSDLVSTAEVAEVPAPSPVGELCPEPPSHPMDEGTSDLKPNLNTNDANDGPLPAHPNSPLPPVILVKQEHQNHCGPSGLAQSSFPTQGLPRSNAVGPGTPNNLNRPFSNPHHPPNAVGPLQGNTSPVNVGMSATDSIKWLAGRFLSNPRSRVEMIDIMPQRSGTSKVLIVLDMNEAM